MVLPVQEKVIKSYTTAKYSTLLLTRKMNARTLRIFSINWVNLKR